MIRRISSTDRKSTRLNSSHMSISYAVFCLKKKNLGCTRWVVTKAYTQQTDEGYVDARVGVGSPVRSLGRAALGPPAAPEAPLFFFNDTATTEIYTLSLHDALPI